MGMQSTGRRSLRVEKDETTVRRQRDEIYRLKNKFNTLYDRAVKPGKKATVEELSSLHLTKEPV